MASEELNQLLEKYWQGELSDVEEMQFKSELKIQKESLNGELKSLAEWFSATENIKHDLHLEDDFDELIAEKISQNELSKQPKWSWWKIAASVLIVFSLAYLGWLLPQNEKNVALTEIGNTQENPEKAFEETKATLLLMANMMNTGKEHLNSLQMFQVAQDKIQKSLKPEKNKKNNSEINI